MEEFEKWYESYLKTINRLHTQRIASSKSSIDRLNEELLKAEASRNTRINDVPKGQYIADLQKKIRKFENSIRGVEKILEGLEYPDPKAMIAQLEKHSLFTGYHVKNEHLNIFTKNIKSGRHSIGRFRFILSSDSNAYIRAVNLDYQVDDQYCHWAVSNYHPCFGDWSDEFMRLSKTGDIYSILDMMCMYIAISGDPHAYMRKANWFERRDKHDKSESDRRKRMIDPDEDYEDADEDDWDGYDSF